MRKAALLALVLLLPCSALAQTGNLPPGLDHRPPSDLPQQELNAMRHHQPSQTEVQRLENQRYGRKGVQQQHKQQGAEVDQLYKELMERSAPSAAGNGPAAGNGR